MAKKMLLPLGRTLVASSALILSSDDAAFEAAPVPEASSLDTRLREGHPSPAGGTSVTSARAAWAQRDWILSLEAHPGRARKFLSLVLAHDHEAYTVAEAGDSMSLTPRHLGRLSIAWFAHPTKMVIDLARIVSVTRSLIKSSDTIASISRSHGFPDPADMSRLFIRFVGLRPGTWRVRFGG